VRSLAEMIEGIDKYPEHHGGLGQGGLIKALGNKTTAEQSASGPRCNA